MTSKREIIKKINQIEDPELLDEIDRWISSLVETSTASKYSKEEISAVREGYEQFKKGNIISQSEANDLFDQWLKEK